MSISQETTVERQADINHPRPIRYIAVRIILNVRHAARMCCAELNGHVNRAMLVPVQKNESMQMKVIHRIAWVVVALCGAPLVVNAAPDGDADRAHPKVFVTDSAITAKIKTKLATDHITSLGRIHVDTDKDGVVWLSGTARTQEDINNAVAMARATDDVKSVQSDIRIRLDD